MATNRYITVSERTAILLEGAVLFARYMDLPLGRAQKELGDWRFWAGTYGIEMEQLAMNTQGEVFEKLQVLF